MNHLKNNDSFVLACMASYSGTNCNTDGTRKSLRIQSRQPLLGPHVLSYSDTEQTTLNYSKTLMSVSQLLYYMYCLIVLCIMENYVTFVAIDPHSIKAWIHHQCYFVISSKRSTKLIMIHFWKCISLCDSCYLSQKFLMLVRFGCLSKGQKTNHAGLGVINHFPN